MRASNASLFDPAERQRLWDCGPIAEKLPLKHKNGMVWMQFTGYCADCKQPIEKKEFHGEITKPFTDI